MRTLIALFDFWNAHGTKALGTLATFVAGLQTAVLAMTPAPPAEPIVPYNVMMLIAGLNAALGVWTVKRGFYNSATQPPQS
jgi:hypothetical protein